MPIDLSKIKWPDRDDEMRAKPESGELFSSAYRTFVTEGSLYVRTLNFNGLNRAVPRESSMITALGYDDGLVYGSTSGEDSWLFQFALPSFREAALPFGKIPDTKEVQGVIVRRNTLWLAANNAEGGRIIRVTKLGLPGDVIQEWGVPRPLYETVAVPAEGERIIKLVKNSVNGLFYGLKSPSGILFSFDPETNETKDIGEVNAVRFFGSVLVEDLEGCLYAFGSVGQMVKYDPRNNKLEDTKARIPCFPGRGPYAKISAAVYDPGNHRIYTGDTEGLICSIDLATGTIVQLGKPVPIGGIDHMVRIDDCRIYGVAGGLEGMSHLFIHDPRIGGLRDLGVCCGTVEKGWYGYKFGAMLATPGGRIVLGEEDHMGCLFSYYPPVTG